MTLRISDLHIAREDALPPPRALQAELPCTDAQARHIAASVRRSARSCAARRMGWKGLIYDPGLDGEGDIGEDLRAARRLLLESHLVEGRQDIVDGRAGLRYGQSVTDGCIGWDATVGVLESLAAAARSRAHANRG